MFHHFSIFVINLILISQFCMSYYGYPSFCKWKRSKGGIVFCSMSQSYQINKLKLSKATIFPSHYLLFHVLPQISLENSDCQSHNSKVVFLHLRFYGIKMSWQGYMWALSFFQISMVIFCLNHLLYILVTILNIMFLHKYWIRKVK